MTYLKSWEEFEKAAEKLYLQEPDKVRFSMKYVHTKNYLVLKVTDNAVVCCVTIKQPTQGSTTNIFQIFCSVYNIGQKSLKI